LANTYWQTHLERAFPILEANLVANLEANDNSKRVMAKAKTPSQKDAYVIEHHGV